MTITRAPRLVRAGVAVALGVALPVAALRAEPPAPSGGGDTTVDGGPAAAAASWKRKGAEAEP